MCLLVRPSVCLLVSLSVCLLPVCQCVCLPVSAVLSPSGVSSEVGVREGGQGGEGEGEAEEDEVRGREEGFSCDTLEESKRREKMVRGNMHYYIQQCMQIRQHMCTYTLNDELCVISAIQTSFFQLC